MSGAHFYCMPEDMLSLCALYVSCSLRHYWVLHVKVVHEHGSSLACLFLALVPVCWHLCTHSKCPITYSLRRAYPLKLKVLMLKPRVGLTVVMSSPFKHLTMVVLPALSRPLRVAVCTHVSMCMGRNVMKPCSFCACTLTPLRSASPSPSSWLSWWWWADPSLLMWGENGNKWKTALTILMQRHKV